MVAALRFIKKKNIGIYYKNKKIGNETNEYTLRDKWFGVLSRKGFSLEIIRKVINIKDIVNADLLLEDSI
jgi:SOS response regulatory protein OraA/RecX